METILSNDLLTEPATTLVPIPVPGQTPVVQLTEQGGLHIEVPNPSEDQIVFLAEVRALAKRVEKHKPWARQEILLLLENAANAGLVAGKVAKGEVVFSKAEEVYFRDMQTRNRLRYVGGSALGVIFLILLAIIMVNLSELNIIKNLAPPDIIVSLFAFAGIGSMTSVLTRLSSLDLKDETSKAMIFLSGGSKPLVAIGFASILYIILKYHLVSISIQSGLPDGELTQDAVNAPYWVAAFLCGFSERFTGDIIARLEPSKSSNNN
jgi:hypothetical protein